MLVGIPVMVFNLMGLILEEILLILSSGNQVYVTALLELSQCNELLGITVQCTMMMALGCHWPFKNHCFAADFDDHIGQKPLTNHDNEAAA